MLKVQKVRLEANRKQKTYFARAAGVARFAYNWALNRWQEDYAKGLKPNETRLRKELNQVKREKYPWMLKVTKVAPQQAIKNLGTAYKRFFNKTSAYPRFKKKGRGDSFRADNGPTTKGADAVKIIGRKIELPKIGWIKLAERLRFIGQIKSVVVSRIADHWYASITMEVTEPTPTIYENQGIVGVDFGIAMLAILSTGEKIAFVKPYRSLLQKIQRYSRELSRKVLNSKNRFKAKQQLSTLHARIANIRKDAIHKLTKYLTTKFKVICIENLNIKGMIKNRKLSRSIMDCSFYEIRRQLEYKSAWYGAVLEVADRFFPSSKLCSSCNEKNKELKLSERIWTCTVCGVVHDRDINAAKNLMQLFESKYTASSAGIYACGEISSG